MYQFSIKPVAGLFNNRLENFNEITIMIVSFHMAWFTDYVSDGVFKHRSGHSMIAFIAINLVVNTAVLLYRIGRRLWLLWQKYKPLINPYVEKVKQEPRLAKILHKLRIY